MTWRVWIPGPLPSMNDLVAARMSRGRTIGGWNAYSDMKRKWEERIAACVNAQNLPAVVGCLYYAYVIREPNRRRDKSNVTAGAVKLIEDALQKCGRIWGDGWEHVAGIEPHVLLAAPGFPAGVTVFIRQEYRLPIEVELTGDIQDRVRYFEGNAYETSGIRIGGGRAKENRPPARKATNARRPTKNR